MAYTIANWTETFEPAESRRVDGGMNWMQISTRIDSRGSIALARLGADGMLAYGVFVRLCQWHGQSTKDARDGALTHSDGDPMDIDHISYAIGLDADTVEQAFKTLGLPSVKWIVSDQLRSTTINDDRERSTTIDDDQCRSLEEKRGEESIKDASHPMSETKTEDQSAASRTEEAWNAFRESKSLPWPKANELSSPSRGNLNARVMQCGTIELFGEGLCDRLRRMAASPHYLGQNEKHWVPSLPWLLKAGSWEKALNLPDPSDLARIPPKKRNPISDEAHSIFNTNDILKTLENHNGSGSQASHHRIAQDAGGGLHAMGTAAES